MSLFQEIVPSVTTTIAEASVTAKAIFPELLPFLYYGLGIYIGVAAIRWIWGFLSDFLRRRRVEKYRREELGGYGYWNDNEF